MDEHNIQNKNLQKQKQRYLRRKAKKHVPKSKAYHTHWDPIVHSFLRRDNISRSMSNKRDVIKINTKYVVKRHLLMTNKQACKNFMFEYPDHPWHFTTFCKAIPREVKIKMIPSPKGMHMCTMLQYGAEG